MKKTLCTLLALACLSAPAQLTNVYTGTNANTLEGWGLRRSFNALNTNDNFLLLSIQDSTNAILALVTNVVDGQILIVSNTLQSVDVDLQGQINALVSGPSNGITAETATNIARYVSTNELMPVISAKAGTNAPTIWAPVMLGMMTADGFEPSYIIFDDITISNIAGTLYITDGGYPAKQLIFDSGVVHVDGSGISNVYAAAVAGNLTNNAATATVAGRVSGVLTNDTTGTATKASYVLGTLTNSTSGNAATATTAGYVTNAFMTNTVSMTNILQAGANTGSVIKWDGEKWVAGAVTGVAGVSTWNGLDGEVVYYPRTNWSVATITNAGSITYSNATDYALTNSPTIHNLHLTGDTESTFWRVSEEGYASFDTVTADGEGITNITRAGVTGLQEALGFLTNRVSLAQLESATNVTTVANVQYDQGATNYILFWNRGTFHFSECPDLYIDDSGTLYASAVSGNGAGLTALNGSNVASGTVTPERMGTNIIVAAGPNVTVDKTYTSGVTTYTVNSSASGDGYWTTTGTLSTNDCSFVAWTDTISVGELLVFEIEIAATTDAGDAWMHTYKGTFYRDSDSTDNAEVESYNSLYGLAGHASHSIASSAGVCSYTAYGGKTDAAYKWDWKVRVRRLTAP